MGPGLKVRLSPKNIGLNLEEIEMRVFLPVHPR